MAVSYNFFFELLYFGPQISESDRCFLFQVVLKCHPRNGWNKFRVFLPEFPSSEFEKTGKGNGKSRKCMEYSVFDSPFPLWFWHPITFQRKESEENQGAIHSKRESKLANRCKKKLSKGTNSLSLNKYRKKLCANLFHL